MTKILFLLGLFCLVYEPLVTWTKFLWGRTNHLGLIAIGALMSSALFTFLLGVGVAPWAVVPIVVGIIISGVVLMGCIVEAVVQWY
jgi:hypothetical protein